MPENGYYRLAGLNTQWIVKITNGNVEPCYQAISDYEATWRIYQAGPGYVTQTSPYPAQFGDSVIQYLAERGYIVTFDANGVQANPPIVDIVTI